MAHRKIAVRSAEAEGTWYDSLPRSTKLPTVAGALIMAVVLMGFGVWGNVAPIAGAVVASGVFVVTGQNKICLLYTSPSPRDGLLYRMPSSA